MDYSVLSDLLIILICVQGKCAVIALACVQVSLMFQ